MKHWLTSVAHKYNSVVQYGVRILIACSKAGDKKHISQCSLAMQQYAFVYADCRLCSPARKRGRQRGKVRWLVRQWWRCRRWTCRSSGSVASALSGPRLSCDSMMMITSHSQVDPEEWGTGNAVPFHSLSVCTRAGHPFI